MTRPIVSSPTVRVLLGAIGLPLAATSVARASMGFMLGYLLFGQPGALGELLLIACYIGALIGGIAFRDELERRLADLMEQFGSFHQRRVIRRVMESDAAVVEAFGAERLAAQMEELARAVAMFDRAFGGLVALVATLSALLLMALVRDPVAFLVLLGVIKVAALVYWINRRILGRSATEAAAIGRAYRSGVADLVLGFKELKLNPIRAQWLLDEMLRPISRRLGRTRAAFETASALNQGFAEIIALLAAGLTAAAAAAVMPEDQLSAGIFAVAIILMPTFALRALPDFMALKTMLTEIDATIAQLPPEPSPPPAERGETVDRFESLSLHDVVFRPAEGRFVLGPVSCRFQAGSITFLVGGNGSGKSTLMNLLCGLTTPAEGEIRLNGTPCFLPAQRHLFSTVFASVHLFDQLYGLPQEAEAEVNLWLERLGIGHVTRVEHGRFTKTDLSTGQRKRVALAVALAEQRPVLLLDEWAADQDPESRRFFYCELLEELRRAGRTIIAVSHDDRYFGVADHLLKLEYGRVVEMAPVARYQVSTATA